jgi:F-type H+-transporting ATPase subunit b
MMEEARRDAQVMAEEMKAKATADIQTERQRLRREIETSKDQALKELQDHAANLATLISTKALKRAVSADDHRRLVDEALNDLQEAGKEWHP